MIQIIFRKQSKSFACGEAIAGEVRWSEITTPVESIDIRLIWFTRGKGDRDVSVISGQKVSTTQANGAGKFEFLAPRFPYSFSGKLISLIWAVEVITFPKLEAESAEIVVGPSGKEVVLIPPP